MKAITQNHQYYVYAFAELICKHYPSILKKASLDKKVAKEEIADRFVSYTRTLTRLVANNYPVCRARGILLKMGKVIEEIGMYPRPAYDAFDKEMNRILTNYFKQQSF